MNSKMKYTGRATSMVSGLTAGGTLCLLITFAGVMILAGLISNEKIPENAIGYCSMIIILMASILGPMFAVRLIKHRRLYVCILTGTIYYVSLLAITALFFGGQYQGLGVTALLIGGGCGVNILAGMRGERSRNGHRVKITHR